MSSPPTVEITELLTPIPGDNPSGEPLLYTATYDAIREARRSDDPNLGQGEWKHELKVANWREVKKLAIDALGTKSKDLQLAVWLAEALVKQNGFAGARDGFRLLGGLIEQFWPSLYPLSEDDDLEFRAQVVESLNKSLPPALSELKLTDSGADRDYSLNEWRESRQVEEKGRRSPEERDALIKEGKITGEQWDKAVSSSSRAFYEALFSQITESQEEYTRLVGIVDEKFGQQSPSLSEVKQSLEECHSLVENIVKRKRELEPDSPATEVEPGPESTQAMAQTNGLAQGQPLQTIRSTSPSFKTAAENSAVSSLEPQDRADALRRLQAIADFFHRTEPQSPVAYLVERAVRWGQMPLEDWLNEVITDQSVLTHIRETLGIKSTEQNGG